MWFNELVQRHQRVGIWPVTSGQLASLLHFSNKSALPIPIPRDHLTGPTSLGRVIDFVFMIKEALDMVVRKLNYMYNIVKV